VSTDGHVMNELNSGIVNACNKLILFWYSFSVDVMEV